MSALVLVKGRIAGSSLPKLDTTHWTANGTTTLCGITAANRVNALNPAKCISCRKCSQRAARQATCRHFDVSRPTAPAGRECGLPVHWSCSVERCRYARFQHTTGLPDNAYVCRDCGLGMFS